MKKYIGIVVSAIIVNTASAQAVCRLRVESDFKTNFKIEGEDLSYRDEIVQALTKNEKEFVVVKNTVTLEGEQALNLRTNCKNVGGFKDLKVVCENKEYDYKLVVEQTLDVDPKNYKAVQGQNGIEIQALSNVTDINISIEWYVVRPDGTIMSGNHFHGNNSQLSGNYHYTTKVTDLESLAAALTNVTQSIHKNLQEYISEFPTCDELLSWEQGALNLKKY